MVVSCKEESILLFCARILTLVFTFLFEGEDFWNVPARKKEKATENKEMKTG